MADDILVINAGSSSVKIAAFAAGRGEDPVETIQGEVEGIGTDHIHAVVQKAKGGALWALRWPKGDGPKDHGEALAILVERLIEDRPGWKPAGIGHRIVHGGMKYTAPVRIDAAVRKDLEETITVAPLHAPAGLRGIDAASTAFPGIPQIACFDTAFHAGRGFVADSYALPRDLYEAGVRRYGFHGLSYESIVRTMRREAPALAAGRMIVCHLGNGASMTAIGDGKSVETTMGFTPTDGLPMGTRCGQLDPGAVLYLLGEKKMSLAEVGDLLEHHSGLLGLSGVGADMRDLLDSTDPAARQAVDCFVYRIVYFAGALAACLGGLDGIVFTAGIGEHAAPIRERVCLALKWLGLELNEGANSAHVRCISRPGSRVSAWVVPTDELGTIAAHVVKLLGLGES